MNRDRGRPAPRPTLRGWRGCLALSLLATAVGCDGGRGQDLSQAKPKTGFVPPASLRDPRLEPLRRASATWELRRGPSRIVVDQVCLVRDLSEYLGAIGTWDRGHWFPVLFDDVETSRRFIRAFRPARIVRMTGSSAPIPADRAWQRAVNTVGASWAPEGRSSTSPIRGDVVPIEVGSTPPGLVLSSPGAPMLAGAVALAAGRFQPLLRLDFEKHYPDTLAASEVEAFDRKIAEAAGRVAPHFGQIGDECDFLTVAGDWPFRCRDPKGDVIAVDDRIGRVSGSDDRWAFAGRLLGDPAESAYRAMCALFLQPESALMFDGYDNPAPPWSFYTTVEAAREFSGAVPTSTFAGEKAGGLDGWHEAFDPSNRAGMVLINSHGSPTVFNLRGGWATTVDVPRTVPSAVVMVHSFSAADPLDPSTIAGRWLANGAFLYFGSMNEPFLQAFRTPRLVADLLAQGLPAAAALRSGPAEPFGKPWRLVLLGDPLYQLRPGGVGRGGRLDGWEKTEGWPVESAGERPETDVDADLATWAIRAATARLQGPGAGPDASPGDDLVEALAKIRRDRLSPGLRPGFDALLVDVLFQANRRGTLKARIAAIPPGERSPTLRRAYETLLAIDLNLDIARGDLDHALVVWSELMKADTAREFQEQSTVRVGRMAKTAKDRRTWASTLREARRDRPDGPITPTIEDELKRVEAADAPGR